MNKIIPGIFVTGTDTGVGKTVVSAAILARYRETHSLCYWKPIQTGIEADDDTATVKDLAGCRADEIIDRGVRLPRPLSPHLSARLADFKIELSTLLSNFDYNQRAWVVEGAGGVLVPINENDLMIDLIARLQLPIVIAARSSLGTINHTLLTIEALRARALKIAGVVMIGEENPENRKAIEAYGNTIVIAEMPHFTSLTREKFIEWARVNFDSRNLLEEYLQ